MKLQRRKGKKNKIPRLKPNVRLGSCNEIHRGAQSTVYLDDIISSAASKRGRAVV